MNSTKFRHLLESSVPSDQLIFPDNADYENVRFSYNLMHDRRPAVIVRTLNIDSIRTVLRIASQLNLEVAIRGGGHHIGGFSTTDGGILIDFSVFRTVEYHEEDQTVSVQPGARLSDIDTHLACVGRCLPGGTVSDTGITGLTLGGGIGWLVGSSGLTCDYLRSAKVLLADGTLLRVNDDTYPDLIAAYRGGGMGGFGVILELCYRTLPMPQLIAGSVTFRNSKSIDALNAIAVSHSLKQYSRVSIAPVLRRTPNGVEISVDFCSAGEDYSELNRLQETIGGDWANVKSVEYTEWQSRFDNSFLPPKRGYWKSLHFSNTLSDFNFIAEILSSSPSDSCTVMLEFYNQEVMRSNSERSLYPLRDSSLGILITARWDAAAEDETFTSWVRDAATVVSQNGAAGGYSNYSSADEELVISGYRSSQLAAIREIGSIFDPTQMFDQGHRRHVGGSVA